MLQIQVLQAFSQPPVLPTSSTQGSDQVSGFKVAVHYPDPRVDDRDLLSNSRSKY